MDDHTRFFIVLWIIVGGLMVLLFVAAAWLVKRWLGALYGVGR